MQRTLLFALAATLTFAAGCEQIEKLLNRGRDRKAETAGEEQEEKKKKPASSASASAGASASAAPSASASASGSSMPVLTIPPGVLKAGSACAAIPRVTDEELPATAVQLGEFTIDALPYPNDPNKPPLTNVTRDEAERLCKEAGKRLCTELEWERACKGPDNATFQYGNQYDKNACETPATPMLGQRDKCKSAFGVLDMHGIAFEWTMSPWGRGQASGLATVRGYTGSSNIVRERCASGQGRDPAKQHGDVGFRCCGGPVNPAAVDLTLLREPVLVEDKRPDKNLVADLLRAMPEDHQKVPGASVTFDRLWKWHPRDNEELIVARWTGKLDSGKLFYEIAVFKVCAGTPTRITRMRGPVEKLETVRQDGSPDKVTIDVVTEKDRGAVTLTYWYGSVSLAQPDWIQSGNALAEKKPAEQPKILRLPPGIRPKK